MLASLGPGLVGRREEVRLVEGAEPDFDFAVAIPVEDLGAADGTEAVLDGGRRGPAPELARNRDLVGGEDHIGAEGCAGDLAAGHAVAEPHALRLASRGEGQLPAGAASL